MNTPTAINDIQSKSRVSLFIKYDLEAPDNSESIQIMEAYSHGELIQLIYGLINKGATKIDGVSIEAGEFQYFNLTHDVVVNGPNINSLFQSSGNIKFIDVHFANQD